MQVIVLPIADRHVGLRPAGAGARWTAAGLRVDRGRPPGEGELQDSRGPAAEGPLHAGGRATGRRPTGPWPCAAAPKGDLGARPAGPVRRRRACRGRRPEAAILEVFVVWRTAYRIRSQSPEPS